MENIILLINALKNVDMNGNQINSSYPKGYKIELTSSQIMSATGFDYNTFHVVKHHLNHKKNGNYSKFKIVPFGKYSNTMYKFADKRPVDTFFADDKRYQKMFNEAVQIKLAEDVAVLSIQNRNARIKMAQMRTTKAVQLVQNIQRIL